MDPNESPEGVFENETPPGLDSPNRLGNFSPGNQKSDQLSQSDANRHGGVHNPDLLNSEPPPPLT